MELSESDIARFWAKVDKRGPDECWEWKGHHDRDGYAIFGLASRPYGAHRVAMRLHSGTLPRDALACHACHNRGCVNPHHLYWGTPAQNTADMYAAGRQAVLVGEQCASSRLKSKQVDDIRKMYGSRQYSQAQIARLFGVTEGAIQAIVANKNWHDANYEPPQHRLTAAGTRNANARLDWRRVRGIRKLRLSTKLTIDELAERFGVSNSCIQKIIYGYTWQEHN